MDLKFSYQPKYSKSRALIIGINKYKEASPLEYAVNDAKEVSDLLIENFGFDKDNVVLLLDEEASKEAIMQEFLKLTNGNVEADERALIFFAGHGCTRTGRRGEVGYLVPNDARGDDFSTFIRWDDLTKNSELIPAKHMLFIMDACYGGLAITRHLKPGSVRFLKDMMIRYSRQVITAGKADEVVADAGGPIPNHSVFTGHLIEALNGNAADDQGVITANGVMAYVYEKVSKDTNSNQTPHYGFFDGDGDFIFKAPGLDALSTDEHKDNDKLIAVPTPSPDAREKQDEDKITTVKKLLSNDSSSIELHDFCIDEVRRFLASTSEDNFSVQGVEFSQDEFMARLEKYESIVKDLSSITACTAYWARPAHKQILQKILARGTDRLDSHGGLVVWLYLRWYPVIFQVYTAGIAAIEGKRYDSLRDIFYTQIGISDYRDKQQHLVHSIGHAILELNRTEVFKKLPGHERHYVPMSEHLYKQIQPALDDILFVGKNYESSFDEFEVMLGLAVAYERRINEEGVWGPIGRFGWKMRDDNRSPFNKILEQAKNEKNNWEPIRQGMFGGDFEKFEIAADEYSGLLSKLNWF
ncbi:MAG: caspase family protein [Desulfuromonadales bacterium]|nr:caspase family protein [Desulfuromonadales bacterium]